MLPPFTRQTMSHSQQSQASEIFEDLFVLELANNHQGCLERGLRIVTDFSRIVRFNNVRAAIKLQFRDVDAFIHKDFRQRDDIRYIKKTLDTRLDKEAYRTLTQAIRSSGCISRCKARPPVTKR